MPPTPSYPRYATIVTSQSLRCRLGQRDALELTRDTLSSYAHPAISPDGQWLYFVSDMPGGEGGLDIWRVRLTAAGLGGVENLGEPVNTGATRCSPPSVPTEIYTSPATDIRAWADSTSSSPTLNSQGDDFGMTFEGPHNRGFFSSNRGDGRGWDHIYSFEKPDIIQTVKGWVYEAEGYELPEAQVYIIGNDGTNLKLSVKGDGSFEQVVEPGSGLRDARHLPWIPEP